ncbi:endolytic transglycosylase MltG [Candidatus Dojkabacteria bacterium]|nr:endolytic transglycosylase MltG [Candidatus Dojkabacteria bacterium]
MKKTLFYLVIVLILAGAGGYFYYQNWYSSALNYTLSDSNQTVEFIVEKGESPSSVGKRLKEANLIKDSNAFNWYLRQEGLRGSIQAGTFEIPENYTMEQIVELLGKAQNLSVTRVTIVEGYKLSQIKESLAKAFADKSGAVFNGNDFDGITKSPDSYTFKENIQGFLDTYKPAGKSLEGFLYPDTYEFENSATTQQVIEALLQQFINKVDGLEKEADFYNKLVLASIIERESFTNDEKDEISSVFTNRLNIGMAIESDATVNYATGKSDPRPTNQDLKIDSPYNTYKYPGLPPTPICSPRIEAVEAALYPANTQYYYFIHEQDGSGQVHFAKTLSEHNANIAKYLD